MKKTNFSLPSADVLNRDQQKVITGGYCNAYCNNSSVSITRCNGTCSGGGSTITCTGPTATLTKNC